MARSRYAPDRGLTTRMTATMFLLGLVFVAFVGLIIGIGAATNSSTGVIALFAIVLGGGMLIGSLFFSDKIALATAGAREVSPNDRIPGNPEMARDIHGVVDRICALADMPKPRVAIADTDMPNAFATGRNADHAVVCVTTGIYRKLDREELEGVLAHEMSHVAHKDVQVMTIASFLAIIAGLMIRLAFYSELFGGGRRNNNDQNAALMMFAIMAISVVVYAVSFVLIRMLSRYRELAADRSGALLTGQPSKLKSALIKVTGDIGRIPSRDLRTAESLNAFYFAPAMSLQGGASLSKLFSTHPSLERRLAELDKVQRQLSQASPQR